MQPKFTLKKFGKFFGLTPIIFALFCLCAGKTNAQTYVNGVLGTGTTSKSGVAAPAGSQWHEMQNDAGNTTESNVSIGFNNSSSSNSRTADDFTVPAGPSWNLTKMYFYGLQVTPTATSPITAIRVQIHSSNPALGPTTVLFGDLTTNRLATTYFSNVYAIANSQVPAPAAPNTNFKVWTVEANVAVTLAPGTYWVEWQMVDAAASFSLMSQPLNARTAAGYNGINFFGGVWTSTIDGGNPASAPDVAVDYAFKINYNTAACSGTPAPGNTISNLGTVCPGIEFSLSLQNETPGAGVTYQWQSASASAGPYTDIPGATNSVLNTTQSATTYYRAAVTCSGNTGFSNFVGVTLNSVGNCYCTPAATTCNLDDEILNVTVGSFSNSSSGCNGSGYTDYTALTGPTFFTGAANPISVKVGPGGTETVYAWIDYNKNGTFETSEFTTLGVGNGSTINGSINIPAGLTGSTRMRVRVRFGATLLTGTGACTGGFFGETEDYTVNFTPCVQGAFTVQPVNKSTQCSGNTTFSVTTTGSLLTYAWQYRVSATGPWLVVPNAAPYSNTTTATLGLSNVPASMTGYEYRVGITGPCTATIFSNAGVLTVTPLIATVTPTTASICLGSIQKITLTNASSPVTSVFNSTTTPVAIPDNTATGVLNTINVSGIPAGAVITNVSVTLNISHTFVGDLDINLIAPNGQNLNLVGGLDGGSGSNGTDNFVNTVVSSTGTTAMSGAPAPRTNTFAADARQGFGPTGNTQTIAGQTFAALTSTLNGNWQLAAADFASQDFGTINSWSVSITYGAPATGVWTSTPAAPNTMFTDAAATVPYVAGAQAGDIWVKPTVNTSYSVVYTTPAPSGCTSAATTVPVTVVTPVTAPVAPTAKTACVGGSVTFTTSATGGPLTYQWEVSTNGGTSFAPITGATSSSLTLSALTAVMNNNQYRAVITAAPCTGSVVTTTAATLTVNPIPVITIASPVTQLVPGRTSTITATSTTAGLVYAFTRNNVATGVTGATQFVSIDSLGTYRATGTLTGVSGCTATSNALVIGTEASERLWIYPNPTDGVFQVRLFQLTDFPTRREVSVWNSTGQMVAHKTFDFVRGMSPYYKMDFDLSRLAPGTYLVKATEKNTTRIVSGLVVIQ